MANWSAFFGTIGTGLKETGAIYGKYHDDNLRQQEQAAEMAFRERMENLRAQNNVNLETMRQEGADRRNEADLAQTKSYQDAMVAIRNRELDQSEKQFHIKNVESLKNNYRDWKLNLSQDLMFQNQPPEAQAQQMAAIDAAMANEVWQYREMNGMVSEDEKALRKQIQEDMRKRFEEANAGAAKTTSTGDDSEPGTWKQRKGSKEQAVYLNSLPEGFMITPDGDVYSPTTRTIYESVTGDVKQKGVDQPQGSVPNTPQERGEAVRKGSAMGQMEAQGALMYGMPSFAPGVPMQGQGEAQVAQTPEAPGAQQPRGRYSPVRGEAGDVMNEARNLQATMTSPGAPKGPELSAKAKDILSRMSSEQQKMLSQQDPALWRMLNEAAQAA